MSDFVSKRGSLPSSLTMNKFFVSKRASMFEVCEETPREKRERSPCGALEISERKLIARKDEKKKASIIARRKCQADPYAEESTEVEDEDSSDIESKICGHANRSVNLNLVKRYLKQSVGIGECVHCVKAKTFSELPPDPTHQPVIWLCAFCGYQGCDRNSGGKHSYIHYRTPRSDSHCIVINTQLWTIWCYECDSEIVPTSSKKLHEVLQYVKRLSEMAPKRTFMSQLAVSSRPTTNLTTQYSGSDSRLYTRRSYEDITKAVKSQKQYQLNAFTSIPKVKGISNLGNTCFFNSVVQNLAQTHFLTQLLDVQLQSGQRVSLPGLPSEELKKTEKKPMFDLYSNSDDEENEIELKPLDLILSEGGPLSVAFGVFLKDMHSVCKNGVVNPSHLFGQICKKSTQFQGYQQQDAHELLRCLLDAIRNEEMLRIKKAILKAFALNEKTDPNTVNSRLRRLIKEYGKQATHTLIDQIFGGQLISTVFCEECHWSSQVFEPFMDLSLPINEEKGKPKKWSWNEDDSVFDCFGRSHNNVSAGAGGASKYQMKQQRKEERRNRKNQNKSGGRTIAASGVSITTEDFGEEHKRNERKARRLTEKRRPEDEEDFRLKEEAERRNREERMKTKSNTNRKAESSKFLLLMEARNSARRKEHHSGDDNDESDEDKEYDEEDEEDCLGLSKKVETRSRDHANTSKIEEEEEDEENDEDEDDEEDESDDDEEETETNETESNVSGRAHSKEKSSKETSDADVEDNTDSECMRNSCNVTRHPSIVVDESTTDPLVDSEPCGGDSRYLRTNSYDHLNYSSDCSERYFTAAGPDTNDELDNINADYGSYHNSTTAPNTTWGTKCDSFSGDAISGSYDENRNAPRVVVEPGHMEEICMKVGELKIRRKSSSRESLLESTKGFKKGSTETLHTFNSMEKINEVGGPGGPQMRKSLIMKRMKQEWIARSLTTLAPRYQCGRQECSVMSCLTNFTAPELLTGNNKIICENCTKLKMIGQDDAVNVKSNASKQLLILSPPAVLTLHLKRFHHVGYNLTKVNRHVHFPLVLDIAPFTSSISLGLSNMSKGQSQVLYGLYGIVEHSGRLNSGHYVAYVRSRPLDTTRTTKQMLNLKPSSQFEINQLVAEMAEKREAEKNLNGGFRINQPMWEPFSMESLEEEIRAGRWFHVSDTYVAEVNVEKVLKAQAYLLFYERML